MYNDIKMYCIWFLLMLVLCGQAFAQSWTQCSEPCGGGTKTQKVPCEFPHISCNVESSIACNTQPCAPSTWNTYTPCSQTYGGGYRFRVAPCIYDDVNFCPKIYEECNTNQCDSNIKCPDKVRFGTLSSCCKTSTEDCGVATGLRPKLHTDVIGGFTSKSGQWPWAAAIVKKSDDTIHCSGSLINKKWVLSAAHCMQYPGGQKYLHDANNYYIMLGGISIKHSSLWKQKIGIKKFVPHEDFKMPEFDIGLIRLKSSATINDYVRPICLPRGEEVQTDVKCFAAGWGVAGIKNVSKRIPSDVLNHVSLSYLPKDACVNGLEGNSYMSNYTTKQNLCYGHLAGGKDTCFGDSGGPLMCQRCSSCGWFVAGITSYGPDDRCAGVREPGVYTNVKKFEYWIRRKIYGTSRYTPVTCLKE